MPPQKRRTPPPPRTGPKRREPTTSSRLGDRRLLITAAFALPLIAIATAGIALATRGGDDSPARALAAAGCTFKSYPSEGASHVQSLDAKVNYKTFPPTSGPHYQQPAVWGSYSDSLVLVMEAHNLEHGGVIIQYGDRVPEAMVAQLQSFYDSSRNGMLLAPLPKLDSTIALTAWTQLATCTAFDEKAFSAFRNAFRGKGPERFPVGSLEPGT
jgi:hypothetical protein